MQSFHISFQLFREFCKGQLFNTCRHPVNCKGPIRSCCANFCPVMQEAKRRQSAEEFYKDISGPSTREYLTIQQRRNRIVHYMSMRGDNAWLEGDVLLQVIGDDDKRLYLDIFEIERLEESLGINK